MKLSPCRQDKGMETYATSLRNLLPRLAREMGKTAQHKHKEGEARAYLRI